MAHTPISGKNAKMRIGSYVLAGKRWTGTYELDELDVTNFESGGYHECIGGVRKVTVQMDGDFNAAENMFDSPPLITDGDTISLVRLYLNGTDGPYWSIPTLLVRSVSNSAEVRGTVTFSISGTGSGVFVLPTGAAT